MDLRRSMTAAASLFMLAACSNLDVNPVTAADSAASAHRKHGTLVMHIRVPKRIRHKAGHQARYVSAGTKGLTISVSGPTDLTESIALTTADPRCSNSTGTLICTISVALLPGSYTGTFTAYDQPPASGAIPNNANVLSTGDHNFSIALGKANVVSVALDGVPSTFTLTMPSAPANVAFANPMTFQVHVVDAAGYTVTGTYAKPVQLTDEDTTGCTTIATSGSDDPTSGVLLSSSDVATINYNGNAFGYATISASATGATTGNGVFKVTVPTFTYTGSSQSYTVPPGVTHITINALGASGSYFEGYPFMPGGLGASVTASYSVAPGEVLDIEVGGAGGTIYNTNAGGYNGGGNPGGAGGGSGGGASDVRQSPYGLADRIIVAGGGGGDGYTTGGYFIPGGNGGEDGDASPTTGGGIGGGAVSGGAGGGNGSSGQLGIGGNGGPENHPGIGGGGGGGGTFGGGGGGGNSSSSGPSGGGGGGSSSAGGQPAIYESGVNSGNGQIIIGY
ncbi:MAG: hypothetical protein JO199_10520 [Candidatus Eremiobacteraeota bacterium]|nr:hypothetical protein [Candidatus Eremiobacteraeota bacterium]